LLTIKTKSGKSIKKYSQFQEEEEVLIYPFTSFLITDFNSESDPQTATLVEMPVPSFTSEKIIYWVDDNPKYNRSIIAKYFDREKTGIEVVEV
jgi:hypothetical protein